MAEMDKILNDLTPKELKVLALVLEGHSTPRIAEILNCRPSTISQDLHRIYYKFGFSTDFKGKNKRVALVRAYQMIQQRNEVKTD